MFQNKFEVIHDLTNCELCFIRKSTFFYQAEIEMWINE